MLKLLYILLLISSCTVEKETIELREVVVKYVRSETINRLESNEWTEKVIYYYEGSDGVLYRTYKYEGLTMIIHLPSRL